MCTRRISVMLVHLVKKRSLPTSISFKTVEYFKRGFQGHRCSKALQGFCKCKCFASPLARRMVRDLKEKDDGGTTGGLSSAGTPHNNYCVHTAVHFRQRGGVEGVGLHLRTALLCSIWHQTTPRLSFSRNTSRERRQLSSCS